MNNIAFALIVFAVSAQNLVYTALRHNSFYGDVPLANSRSNRSQQREADVSNQVVEIPEESPTASSISTEVEEASSEYSSNEKRVSESSEQVVSPNDNEVISYSQNDPSSLSTVDSTEGARSLRRENRTTELPTVHATPVSSTGQPVDQADSQPNIPASREESITQTTREENRISDGGENEVKTKGQPDEQSLPSTVATTTTETRLKETTALITEKPETTTAPPSTSDKKCKNRLSVKRCKRLRKYFRTINACKRIHVMRTYCKKYCGLCEKTQAKKAYTERKKRARRNCKDFSRVLCSRFSAFCRGDSKNGRTMRHFCKRTCDQC